MLNYKGNLWIRKNYVLGNKTQYPLFLGTMAGTLLLFLYCDFVLLLKYCEMPNLGKVIISSQILSLYFMFKVNMTEPGVQLQLPQNQDYKICEKCKVIKPERCYHCKFCEHCVDDFEAHCFLMATCIGKRNIKYLLGLVSFTGIALYLLLMILIIKLFVTDCNKELTFIILNIVSLVLTLVHLNPFIYTTWRNASQVLFCSNMRIGPRDKQQKNHLIVLQSLFFRIICNFLLNNMKVNYMLILLIIESLFLVAYLWYIIHSHASKDVSFYVKTLTLISWLISFSLIIILPLDIYKNEHQLENTGIETIWIVLYWVTFFLTWIFLPITLDYESAGEFTFKQKLVKAIKINLIIYGIGAVFGIAFTIYMIVQKKFSIQALIAFTVVMSNGLGLIIVTFFLGYAMVAIPRQFYRERNHQIQLNLKYYWVNKTDTQYQQEELDLDDLLIEILGYEAKYRHNEEYQPYIQQILSIFSQEQIDNAKIVRLRGQGNGLELEDVTLDKLADLHKKAKELSYDVIRNKKKLELLTQEAIFIEDIISSQNGDKIVSDIRPQRQGIFGNLIDKIQFLWYVKLWKYIMYLGVFVFISLAVLLTISEIAIFGQYPFDVFEYFITPEENFFEVQILILIPLIYVLYCIQYGLFSIRFFRYGFYNYGFTDGPSLIFSATFISRIAFPLAFNFFWMFNESDADISNVVGNFNFDQYLKELKLVLPILLILLIICNIFDIYDKLLGALGFVRFQFNIGYADEHTEEGQEYVQKIRTKLSKEYANRGIQEPLL